MSNLLLKDAHLSFRNVKEIVLIAFLLILLIYHSIDFKIIERKMPNGVIYQATMI